MWTALERGLDGVVGRMMQWLTSPPVKVRKIVRQTAPAAPTPLAEVPVPAASADAGDRALLAALADAGGSATMNELMALTGTSRAELRRQLTRLSQAGDVERVGAGIAASRYRLTRTA